MSSTNVNSSKNETLAFVVYGADKELDIKGKGMSDFNGPFGEKEIIVHVNNAHTKDLKRRTIPIRCQEKINAMKATRKTAKNTKVDHENR